MGKEHYHKHHRAVKNELEGGPKSHDELCESVGLEWYELQPVIRRLRQQNEVVITLDKRYELT